MIPPEDQYTFTLPSSVKEARISNTQSGNFCMVRRRHPQHSFCAHHIMIALNALPPGHTLRS